MKILMTVFLAALPAAADAACMCQGGGMMARGGHHAAMGMHLAAVLWAVMACLGYFVLAHAYKQESSCVKRVGNTVGTLLVILGLLGVLCGVVAHVKKQLPCNSCNPDHAAMMPAAAAPEMPAMPEKAPELPKKKGK